MIKGSQKQLIVLRTGNSRYFDEAYFVLRREIKTGGRVRGDILTEANRILQESVGEPMPPRRRYRAVLLFFCGLVCGAAVCAAILLAL